jgi:hypothetical protein
VLGLVGKKGEEPEVALDEMEAHRARSGSEFAIWLSEVTGLTTNRIAKDLSKTPELLDQEHLHVVCDNNELMYQRVLPFASLLRRDLRGLPTVFLGPEHFDDGNLPGSLYVTKTSERRDSGTQYTTRDFADEIVRYALEPIVYSPGPAEGADPADWKLKPAAELLKLKVCDPAVGSGAILVAACRYLAERLVEAWQAELERGEQPAGLPPGFIPDEDVELLARRVITDHCLFGVDRNPMAAEMAKLSLWLTTMARERPFTFLDHAIHAGDSLLGITSLEQLEAFHLDPKRGRELHKQGRTEEIWGIAKTLAKRRELAIEYGRRLSGITVLDTRDAEEKRALYEKLSQELGDLEAVGDLLIGASLATAGRGEQAMDSELKRLMFEFLRPAYEAARTVDDFNVRIEDIRTQAAYLLDTGRPDRAPEREPLHWPLVFPEVFLDPARTSGFDAMVGNPPFLGGKRISGPMGSEYREYLVEQLADRRKGNCDLVGYFYLRCSKIANGIGMLATNTIAQGDTRQVGLDFMTASGWTIHRAVKSRPWPGAASLDVALLWIRRGAWAGEYVLDGRGALGITPSLDPISRAIGNPYRLSATTGMSFIGSALNTEQFIIQRSEATDLLRDPLNAEVVRPYLNGEDLNSHPTHVASRYVVSFFDWPLSRAQRFEQCYGILLERVKPEVQAKQKSYGGWILRWWQFWRPRAELYNAIAGLDRVIVIARVSPVPEPAFVSTNQVFNDKTVVFASDDYFLFGVLSATFHASWVRKWSSTLGGSTVNYAPTDCFETFPQPPYRTEVEELGKALDDHRRPLMIANNEGLTKTYNRVHKPDEQSAGIVQLRERQRELDLAVRDAYGWDDLDLDHGFHETSQGVRYTVGSSARTEILDLLLELNHQRYAEEVAAGLHDKGKAKKVGKRSKALASAALFDDDGEQEEA